jgi:hypothetical protein
MNLSKLGWKESAPGVRVLKLYDPDLSPDWPRIIILDLTAERFQEFERDPLAFDRTHKLYPEQPTLWVTQCAKPPRGQGIPRWAESTGWRVVLDHGKTSGLACAARRQADGIFKT